MKKPFHFILASGSPRRNRLLSQLGLSFDIIVSDADETLLPGETPTVHTARLAEAKARVVADKHPDKWVLGADTIVFIDGLILGKPADEEEAFSMINRISGNWHTVVSSFCILRAGKPDKELHTVETKVYIRSLTPEEIRWYISTGEPMDKAGAYAIQGIGACIVEKIEGSYTNVVGLPLAETVQALENLDLLTLMA